MRLLAKLTNLQLTRNDPNRRQSGRRNRLDISWKAPLIGGKRLGPGKSMRISALFYKTNKTEIDKFVAAGVLRLEVSPAVREEWEESVLAAPDVLPSVRLRLEQESRVNEQLQVERTENIKYEVEKELIRRESVKASLEARKGIAPDLSDIGGAIGFLSNVPPAQMTEEQRLAMRSHVIVEQDDPVLSSLSDIPPIEEDESPVVDEGTHEAVTTKNIDEPVVSDDTDTEDGTEDDVEDDTPKVTKTTKATRKRKPAVTRKRGSTDK